MNRLRGTSIGGWDVADWDPKESSLRTVLKNAQRQTLGQPAVSSLLWELPTRTTGSSTSGRGRQRRKVKRIYGVYVSRDRAGKEVVLNDRPRRPSTSHQRPSVPMLRGPLASVEGRRRPVLSRDNWEGRSGRRETKVSPPSSRRYPL